MLLLTLLSLGLVYHQALGLTSYANDFIEPDYILEKKFPAARSAGARATIKQWADELAAEGPWSVTSKSVLPPSRDKHDYLSWAPYWWPNCSNAGNTTELPPEEVWVKCNYVPRDGEFNPDRLLVNDTGHFAALSDAVLYNALQWALEGEPSTKYSKNVVNFIKTWFLDEETRMNPNLNFAQMQRGPNGQKGSHTGILDLKTFSKVVSGLLLLRQGKSPDWTTEIDSQLVAWVRTYITWLEVTDIALEEAFSANNHGTFYYNQLAALKIFVGDLPGAKNVTDTFFKGIYQNQIEANGEQPFEAARTRPYHYRAYNLAAMITNARIAAYADPANPSWNATTKTGATIKDALDFTLTVKPETSDERGAAPELYPVIAIVGAVYGDPGGKYAKELAARDPDYADDAYFLWNQPFAGESLGPQNNADGSNVGSADGGAPNNRPAGNGSPSVKVVGRRLWAIMAGICAVKLVF